MNPEWERFHRARQGDEHAWRELAVEFQPRLTALALLITGSATAAEDVVQETFVRALGARIRDTAGTVSGYLGTIAYRLAVKEVQRARRNTELSGLDPATNDDNPLDRILNNERDCLVAEAIGTLDEEHRDVLILRCYAGHSYDEISGLLHIPLGTVKSRIFYAIKSCREVLRQRGVLE